MNPPCPMQPEPTAGAASPHVLKKTQEWLQRAVIGLNLCPFAKAVQTRDQIRYVVCEATDTDKVLDSLDDEMRHLVTTSPETTDTTLLILPNLPADFAAFNDLLVLAQHWLVGCRLNGVLQIASFHPAYRFADTAPDDTGNLTNRAPYPTLHLLREGSLTRAIDAFGDTSVIVERNLETLKRLGREGWIKQLAG